MTSLLGSAGGISLKRVRVGACPQRNGRAVRKRTAPRRNVLAGQADGVIAASSEISGPEEGLGDGVSGRKEMVFGVR
jgi:hypothetical protein